MSNEITAPESRVITVNLPEKAKLDARAAAVLATVEALAIDSHGMMEVAAEELIALKTDYKKLEEARVFHVGPLNSEVKYINNWFRDALAMMEQAEGALKRKMLTFQHEQEQKRREEQARIEAEQQAERARLAQEEADPQQRAADEITAIVMTPPVLSPAPKLAGISTKATYKGKVTDLLALVRFVAKRPEFLNLLKADDAAINQIAKAQRDACTIEGILVYEDKVLSARRA